MRGHGHRGGLRRQPRPRASMHRTEVSLLERSQRSPRIDTFLKFARAPSVDPAALLEGIAWVPEPGGEGRIAAPDRH